MGKYGSKTSLIVILLLTAAFFAFPHSANCQVTKDHTRKVVKNRSYSSNGFYYFSFVFYNNTNLATVFKTYLSAPDGTVLCRFKDANIEPVAHKLCDYGFNFSNVEAGIYTIHVESRQYKWSFKVNHNPTSTLIYKDTRQILLNDGSLCQQYEFERVNCKNKKLYFEIYDENGQIVSKPAEGILSNSNKGTFYYDWSYYQENSVKVVESGNYTIKFWVQGQNPKQETKFIEF